MRVRLHPGAVGCFAAGLVHVLAKTVRVHREFEAPAFDPRRPDHPRAVYAFWHGRIMLVALTHLNSGVCIPISRHIDGEYVARMARHIGARPIRGSTRRGGAQALRRMIQASRDADIAVTPDGPRGPGYVVQPGIVHVARLSGRPIVPAGLEVAPAWQAPSWDEFTVPLPFARLALCGGSPITVPEDAGDDDVERLRARLQSELLRLTARARNILAHRDETHLAGALVAPRSSPHSGVRQNR